MNDPDPLLVEALATFDTLFDEALAAGEPDRTAMVVATASADACPSARTVLLKAHDTHGFVFYTHLAGTRPRTARQRGPEHPARTRRVGAAARGRTGASVEIGRASGRERGCRYV